MKTCIYQPETHPLAERHADLLNEAKAGIHLAFLVSGMGGFLLPRWPGSRSTGEILESEPDI